MSGENQQWDGGMSPLILGTRGSPLAMAQTKIITDFLDHKKIPYRVAIIKTTGDVIQHKPLYDVGGKALFSKELESSLLKKDIDIAIHSLKDLETPRPCGLTLCAYLKRADVRDVLVTRFDEAQNKVYGCSLQDLPKGTIVGTSAPRRMAQILHKRPDLSVIPVRGNVGTRLSKLKTSPLSSSYETSYDAILFAKAGLDRLAITVDNDAILPIDYMIPAAGQGIIALECRRDDLQRLSFLHELNDPTTERAACLERGFIEALDGINCRSPVGVYAMINHEGVSLCAMLQVKNVPHFFKKTYALGDDTNTIMTDFLAAGSFIQRAH